MNGQLNDSVKGKDYYLKQLSVLCNNSWSQKPFFFSFFFSKLTSAVCNYILPFPPRECFNNGKWCEILTPFPNVQVLESFYKCSVYFWVCIYSFIIHSLYFQPWALLKGRRAEWPIEISPIQSHIPGSWIWNKRRSPAFTFISIFIFSKLFFFKDIHMEKVINFRVRLQGQFCTYVRLTNYLTISSVFLISKMWLVVSTLKCYREE